MDWILEVDILQVDRKHDISFLDMKMEVMPLSPSELRRGDLDVQGR